MNKQLSVRELEVLRELAQGWTNKEIGARLMITDQTVKSHVARISRKMGTSRRVRLVMFAFLRGHLEFDDEGRLRIAPEALTRAP